MHPPCDANFKECSSYKNILKKPIYKTIFNKISWSKAWFQGDDLVRSEGQLVWRTGPNLGALITTGHPTVLSNFAHSSSFRCRQPGKNEKFFTQTLGGI